MNVSGKNLELIEQIDPQYWDLMSAAYLYSRLPDCIDGLSGSEAIARARKLPRNRIERTRSKSRSNNLIVRHASVILGAVPKDEVWRSTRSIGDLLQSLSKARTRQLVGPACNLLVQERKFQRSSQGTVNVYRHLLQPLQVGDIVAEWKGTNSERRGIIKEFRYLRRKGLFPIVEWEDNTVSISSEEILELA